jgi:hypothetical protein
VGAGGPEKGNSNEIPKKRKKREEVREQRKMSDD